MLSQEVQGFRLGAEIGLILIEKRMLLFCGLEDRILAVSEPGDGLLFGLLASIYYAFTFSHLLKKSNGKRLGFTLLKNDHSLE